MSINTISRGFSLALVLFAAACGDDSSSTECGAGTMLVDGTCVASAECGNGTTLSNGECVADAVCGAGTTLTNGMCLPDTDPPVTTYRQVEHLGRPGIAEALLISPAFLEGYNATAPSFAGAPAAAVTAISAEAKTVLKAVFHGVCLLNGVAGLTAANGAKPGGVQCNQVGADIFTTNMVDGTMIDADQATAAQTYADAVFGLFITDTMRVDTTQATQGYFAAGASLCGAGAGAPGLCGGRVLADDVIDITYYFLFAGATLPTAAVNPGPVQNQVVALVSDGVFLSTTTNVGSLGTPDPSNTNQFKQGCANCAATTISNTFPYSAPPL